MSCAMELVILYETMENTIKAFCYLCSDFTQKISSVLDFRDCYTFENILYDPNYKYIFFFSNKAVVQALYMYFGHGCHFGKAYKIYRNMKFILIERWRTTTSSKIQNGVAVAINQHRLNYLRALHCKRFHQSCRHFKEIELNKI